MSIWFGDVTVEALEARGEDTMARHLDIRFIEVGERYLKASMPVDNRTVQPLRLLNGGASCALAETIASTAANAVVDQSKYFCVGLEINANHIRSARSGRVIAKATPFHLGQSTQVWEIRITDEKDHLICIARHTVAVIKRKKDKDKA